MRSPMLAQEHEQAPKLAGTALIIGDTLLMVFGGFLLYVRHLTLT